MRETETEREKKVLKNNPNARLDLQPMLRHVVLKKFKNNKMEKKNLRKGEGKWKKKKRKEKRKIQEERK